MGAAREALMRGSTTSSVKDFALRLAVIVFLAALTVAAVETVLASRLADRAIAQESVARVDAAASSTSTAAVGSQDVAVAVADHLGPLADEPDVTDVVAVLGNGDVVLPEIGNAVTTDPEAIDDGVRTTIDAVLEDGRTRVVDGTGSGGRSIVAALALPDQRGALMVSLDPSASSARAQQLWLLFGLSLALGALALAPLVFLGGARGLIRRYGQALASGNTDDLTGLGTRRAFRRDLATQVVRAREDGRALTLALMDVNGLELVNSTVGRRRGDALLAALGKALGAAMHQVPERRTYRVGGDAFAVVMPGTSLREAFSVADDLRATIARTAAPLTTNVGLAGLDGQRCTDVETLLIAADAALFEARALGGNRVVGSNDPDSDLSWMATSGVDDAST
jgi:diguanylate cyclase (GGDEF)-like protein